MADPFVSSIMGPKSCFHFTMLIAASPLSPKPPFTSFPVSSLRRLVSSSPSLSRHLRLIPSSVSNSPPDSGSSNFDIIETIERADGSVVFRFGNVSEVVEKVQLEESTGVLGTNKVDGTGMLIEEDVKRKQEEVLDENLETEIVKRKSDHIVKKNSKPQPRRRKRGKQLAEVNLDEGSDSVVAETETAIDKETVVEVKMSSSSASILSLENNVDNDEDSFVEKGEELWSSSVISRVENVVNVEDTITPEEASKEKTASEKIAANLPPSGMESEIEVTSSHTTKGGSNEGTKREAVHVETREVGKVDFMSEENGNLDTTSEENRILDSTEEDGNVEATSEDNGNVDSKSEEHAKVDSRTENVNVDPTSEEIIKNDEIKERHKPETNLEDMQVSKVVENGDVDAVTSDVADENVGKADTLVLMPIFLPTEAKRTLDEETIHVALSESFVEDSTGNSKMLEEKVVDSDEQSSKIPEVSAVQGVEKQLNDDIFYRGRGLTTGFVLSSGAASLQHPSKELTGREDASCQSLTGREDAYFVTQNWLGVADGVGQWSLEGTKAGNYAQEFIHNCKKIVSNCKDIPVIKPEDVLAKAAAETHLFGSATLLVAHFDGLVLHVANIGDSGFILIRKGAVYAKSSHLVQEFNFPTHFGKDDDPTELMERHTFELEEGDVVVTATDGLFDNLYGQEIALMVTKSLEGSLKAKEMAELLASSAQEVGRSRTARSPYADAAQAAGYVGYTGGKPDDVTVIVSVVG